MLNWLDISHLGEKPLKILWGSFPRNLREIGRPTLYFTGQGWKHSNETFGPIQLSNYWNNRPPTKLKFTQESHAEGWLACLSEKKKISYNTSSDCRSIQLETMMVGRTKPWPGLLCYFGAFWIWQYRLTPELTAAMVACTRSSQPVFHHVEVFTSPFP